MRFCGQGINVDLGRHRILYSVDFTAPAGQVKAIVGPNGSGKITLSPQWALHFGGRYCHVKADLEASGTALLSTNSDNRLLVSAGVVWTPNDRWAVRGLFSQGYNYPTLNQLFTQTTARGQLTLPNPGLDPETADNIDLGAGFDDGGIILDATLFYTKAQGYIVRQALPPVGTLNQRGAVDISEHATVSVQLNNIFDRAYKPFDQLSGGERSMDVVLSA